MKRFAVVTAAALTAVAVLRPSLAAAESADADEPSEKSPTTALVIASGATAGALALTVPAFVATVRAQNPGELALGAAGMTVALIAPSAGHVYAGDYKRAAITTGLRVGGVLAIAGGLSMVSFDHEDDSMTSELGLAIAAGGIGLIAGATIYDIYDAPKAARRTNERRRLLVAPTALSAKDGTAPGLAVAGTF